MRPPRPPSSAAPAPLLLLLLLLPLLLLLLPLLLPPTQLHSQLPQLPDAILVQNQPKKLSKILLLAA